MNTATAEARREAVLAITETFDEIHRVAVEEGDEALSEAILAQFEALYEQAMKGEQEAVREAKELAEAHSTRFLLGLKGAGNRMRGRIAQVGASEAA
jgi:hypothetical protein